MDEAHRLYGYLGSIVSIWNKIHIRYTSPLSHKRSRIKRKVLQTKVIAPRGALDTLSEGRDGDKAIRQILVHLQLFYFQPNFNILP